REAADAERLAHDLLDAARIEVGRARAAFLRVAIDGDPEPAVALALDGLELAHPNGYRQPFVVAHSGLGLVRAEALRELDRLLRDRRERVRNAFLFQRRPPPPRMRRRF